MTLRVTCRVEMWPIAGRFAIAREVRTVATVVVAEVSDGASVGRGECVPYPRFGETAEDVRQAIAAVRLERPDRALLAALPPGAARNAIDCALWDLQAKAAGTSVAELCGLPALRPVTTAYTLSLGTPEEMAAAAAKAADRPVLKVKLGGGADDGNRIAAVRMAAPHAVLIADANEGWREADLVRNFEACVAAGVALIEQPLPAGGDEALRAMERIVPVCADESVHVTADLDRLAGKYDAVNVKLDKAGGLTEALALTHEAKRRGFAVMVGCMVGTSLAMAPAMIPAQTADFVDLDGPLLLARDRSPGLIYDGSSVRPPEATLWG